MTKITLTELEAIHLTMDYGHKGEELESAKFKKLGCLDGQRDKVTGEFKNSGMIKFIRKLESIYETVEVEGKGKKRTYTLSNKRDEVVAVKDNRKNNGLSDDDLLMSQYMFNRLVELNRSASNSLYGWGTDCGVLNVNLIDDKLIQKLFEEEYYDMDLELIKTMTSDYLKDNVKSYARNSFKLLQQQDLIDVTEHYSGKDLEGEYVALTKREYDLYQKQLKSIVQQFNCTLITYKFKLKTTPDMSESINQLQQFMNLKSVWVSYSVKTNSTDLFDVTKEQFATAFYSKLERLINNLKRNDKKDYCFAHTYRKYNLLTVVNAISSADIHIKEESIPEYMGVHYVIDKKRWNRKFISNAYKISESEINDLLSDDVFEEVEEVKPTTEIGHMATLDDILADVHVEAVELEPFNMSDYIDNVVDINTYKHDKELINCDNMSELRILQQSLAKIKFAFNTTVESQSIAVGSF